MDVVRSPQGVGQGKGGGPQQNGAAVMNKDKGSGKAERLRWKVVKEKDEGEGQQDSAV